MPFGQLVIGPPGSGKTTYCHGVSQFYRAIKRDVVVINLDPANLHPPYEAKIDIRDLVDLPTVMEELSLGPNGGLLYCMEYLEKNIDWLQQELEALPATTYLLFDCPGQVELYTNHNSVRNIVQQLVKWDYRLCAVHLVDAHYCSEPTKFISVLMVSLSTMLQLELPHINVLSKIDIAQQYGELSFNLEFYTDVLDLSYLLERIDERHTPPKFRRLTQVVSQLVEDFSLVSFLTLNITDKESVFHVVQAVEKANGCVFGGLEQDNRNIMDVMVSEGVDYRRHLLDITEKYLEDDSGPSAPRAPEENTGEGLQ